MLFTVSEDETSKSIMTNFAISSSLYIVWGLRGVLELSELQARYAIGVWP